MLRVCNFNLHFLITLAGWEGSAYGARVLHGDARVRHILPLYDGWFYLGDAGTALSLRFFTSLQSVHYHL